MKIFVKVKANTSQERVRKTGGKSFEVWTKEKPAKGKANKDVLKILAEHFSVSVSETKIISGFKSREKVISIPEELKEV